MPSEKRDPDCASGITSSWLNPDSVEGTFPQQSSIRNRIERHSAGHAQGARSCFAVHCVRHAQHDFFAHDLNASREIHLTLSEWRFRNSRWSTEELIECGARH